LSLLEVMLAMAILGGCVAAIGELVRLGARHAEEVRILTEAQLLCEGKIEEIEAGITAPESVSSAPFDLEPEWMYSVTVTPMEDTGLMEVRVTVEQVEATRMQPYTFSLVRWMLDPAVEEMTEEPFESTESDDAAAGSSGEATSDAAP
jgi:Tfp pilus assembly protein PilV